MLLSLFLAACTSNQPDDTVIGADDTGTVQDTDTDTDTDSDTTALTLNYDADATGLGIALLQMTYDDTGNPQYDFWVGFDAAGSSQTIDLSSPPDAAIGESVFGAGAVGATYVVALYEDTDGSGGRDTGEAWVSAGAFAIWLEAAVPEDLAAAGVTAGWNIVAYPESAIYPLTGVPVALHRPVYDITIGGTVEGMPAGLPGGVMLYSTVAETPMYDAPLDGTSWSIALSGPPPAEHEIDGVPYAIEQPISYLDAEPTGFDAGDSGYSGACLRGTPVYLTWSLPEEFADALYFLAIGVVPGWIAGVPNSHGTLDPIAPSDYTALVMDQSC